MLEDLSLEVILFIAGVGGLTAMAAAWDIRTRRIPNALTLPAFLLGLVYQGLFNGLPGLGDAGLAFAMAFGTLFVLWMVGGGGGGDVKLMGALSVWLGFHMTLLVMIASTLFVLGGTLSLMIWSVLFHGSRKTKDKYLATGKHTAKELKKKKYSKETSEQKQSRRIMAYAVPVALATWLVVIWKLPML